MRQHPNQILVVFGFTLCLTAWFASTLLAQTQTSNGFVGTRTMTKQVEFIDVQRPNVLFISVDDLRPELGCYGNQEIKTPNFDAFSKTATTFMRAYCQAAVCAPSRASVMTGLRPDTNRVWDLRGKFRVNLPDVVTIPQHFHQHGYYTVSMGKIFHNHMPDRVSFDEPDLRPKKYMTPEMIDREPESFYHDEELNAELAEVRKRRLARNPNAYADGWAYGRSTESFDGPDTEFYDGAQTELAIETMRRLKEKDQPFFPRVGILPTPLTVCRTEEILGLVRTRRTFDGVQPVPPQRLAGDGDEFRL